MEDKIIKKSQINYLPLNKEIKTNPPECVLKRQIAISESVAATLEKIERRKLKEKKV